MPGRVLNFSEFFGKYSSETGSEKNLDDFTQSSSNFEEGFDDATYDQNQLGPNRPVSSEIESTPAQPGEMGAPAFSSKMDASMNAPEEQEEPAETKEETEEEAETEETEVPEPEAGANPKKEKVEESKKFSGLHSFGQFIRESYSDWESEYDELSDEYDDLSQEEEDEHEWSDSLEDEEFGANPEGDMMDDTMCPNCGMEIGYSPEGASCGCNM